MAITDWNLNMPRGSEPAAAAPCQGSDLKAMLHTIVLQLTDSDRRHSDALQDMQERLAAMGREASSIRGRVPDVFVPAFERIEAGMAELADRIGEATRARAAAQPAPAEIPAAPSKIAVADRFEIGIAQPSPQPFARAGNGFRQEAPAALRSASDAPALQRTLAGIDPFDVIESTLSSGGADADPWDRSAADALAGLYDNARPTFSQSVTTARAPSAAAVDQSPLDQRFSEIAKRLEESLADLNADQSFFALGQRLDLVERTIQRVSETAATHADVEGIRQIESHISVLAEHLDAATSQLAQLARLDGIDARLGEISDRLIDVHQIALTSGAEAAGAPPAAFDAESARAIARAAVDEAKQTLTHLARDAQPQQSDEIRGLIERLLAEGRAGDENTAVLLDTLQQAMIRLLDRVDAMEMTQQQAIEANAQVATQAAEAGHYARVDFGREPNHSRAAPNGADHYAEQTMPRAPARLRRSTAPSRRSRLQELPFARIWIAL